MKNTFTFLLTFIVAQAYAQFVPRPAISFTLNGKVADNLKQISKTDTLLEVKTYLLGEQKKKMPNVTFLIDEVEIELHRNDRKIAGLVLPEGKGNFAPLSKMATSGDKYIMTARRVRYIQDNIVKDVGIGNVVKNYVIE